MSATLEQVDISTNIKMEEPSLSIITQAGSNCLEKPSPVYSVPLNGPKKTCGGWGFCSITLRRFEGGKEEPMRLCGPHTYQFDWQSGENPKVVKSKNKKLQFSKPVTDSCPKLYVISHGRKPIYVGGTTQSIGDRLRTGVNPKDRQGGNKAGRSRKGYGYLWRHYPSHLSPLTMDIWILKVEKHDFDEMKDDPSMKRAMDRCNEEKKNVIVIETVEAEVVLLIQQRDGQWPKYQSEIHFHQSQPTHRKRAEENRQPLLSTIRRP